MRRKDKKIEPEVVPEWFYYTAEKGLAATKNGHRAVYMYTDMCIRVTGLLDPVEGLLGPFTEEELRSHVLANQQDDWDRIARQRGDAWDEALRRALKILGGEDTTAVAELRLLIFQMAYGASSTGPDMHDRPTSLVFDWEKE